VERPDGEGPVLWPEQLTFEADRVMGVWCSPAPGDERLIYARDSGGNENAQLFLLSTDGGHETALTRGYEQAMHGLGAWSADGRQILFTANRRDPGLFDLYLQPLDGEARLVWKNPEPGFVINLSFSPDGRRAIMTHMASSFHHDVIEVELASGEARRLTPARDEARYEQVCYAADGRSLYINTDLDSEVLHIRRLWPEDGRMEPVVALSWDVELMTMAPDGRSLAYVVNVDGASELYLLDLATGQARAAPGLGATPGVISAMDEGPVFSRDSRALAFSLESAIRPSDIHVWDLASDTVRPVTRSSQGGIPAESFVAPEPVHYPTFDGLGTPSGPGIPAWFFRPAGVAAGRTPVIVLVHGGPEAQARPYFQPLIQYLIQQGYAVLVPNVRGSTGYGKAYSHLDDVDKRMDSVADLAAAARWLREQPGVDGERLVVYGGSYGGFMVLSALATYPELWAAAVDIVGISNFVTFLENTSGYRRAHREAEYGSLATDRAFLERISPLHHVDQMRAPLFVIHGANDPRVPLSEAHQLVNALKARGVPVELMVFDDEGHGLVRLKNKLAAYPAAIEFLARYV
jgi:dipeptidyl aminopeptidase/acylaminoacyl peptidase